MSTPDFDPKFFEMHYILSTFQVPWDNAQEIDVARFFKKFKLEGSAWVGMWTGAYRGDLTVVLRWYSFMDDGSLPAADEAPYLVLLFYPVHQINFGNIPQDAVISKAFARSLRDRDAEALLDLSVEIGSMTDENREFLLSGKALQTSIKGTDDQITVFHGPETWAICFDSVTGAPIKIPGV